jgi:hypothetical protein
MKYKKEILTIIAVTILTTLVSRWLNKYFDKAEEKTGIPI